MQKTFKIATMATEFPRGCPAPTRIIVPDQQEINSMEAEATARVSHGPKVLGLAQAQRGHD